MVENFSDWQGLRDFNHCWWHPYIMEHIHRKFNTLTSHSQYLRLYQSSTWQKLWCTQLIQYEICWTVAFYLKKKKKTWSLFSASCFQKHCFSHTGVADYWPWKLIWKTKLPVKVICYSRLALHGACLTQDNLIRRNCMIANRCYMCRSSAESMSHLLLHCTVANDYGVCLLHFWTLLCHGTKSEGCSGKLELMASWYSHQESLAYDSSQHMLSNMEWNRTQMFWCLSTPNHSLKTKCLLLLFSWDTLSPVIFPQQFLDFVSSMHRLILFVS